MINSHPGERFVNISVGFIATTPTLKELIDHPWGLKQRPLLIHLLIPDENKEFPCKQGGSFLRLRGRHDSDFRGWTICPNIDLVLWSQWGWFCAVVNASVDKSSQEVITFNFLENLEYAWSIRGYLPLLVEKKNPSGTTGSNFGVIAPLHLTKWCL